MKDSTETKEISLLDADAIETLVQSKSPLEIKEMASQLNETQICIAVLSLTDASKPDWAAKLHALLCGVSSLKGLEALGRVVNSSQLIEFLDFLTHHAEEAWRLFPLFITIPNPLFSQMLLDLPQKCKQQLQLLCTTEPLQHHLWAFVHELNNDFDNVYVPYVRLEEEILELNPSKLTPQGLKMIQKNIEDLRQQTNLSRSKIENALSLAWNAANSDLIEMLSTHREYYERFLFNRLGHPTKQSTRASGLYRTLEQHLSTVFGPISYNYGKDLDALKDNEPAIEALARLSLWYIEDYWKVGLLPEVTDPKNLTLRALNDATLLSHYQNAVTQNLRLIGLKTVKDFKRNHLVSKALLKNYISLNQQKLKKGTPSE